ncbi:chitinase [Kutzneria buriramensis]|uniref:Glycosyl hydrolase family 18 (Putative chitinase) n=1 Tax=Kutzneria buriramensis TaxID=1045776 RepID=A0A3E0H2Z1_9PSEU|nr:chitinase [Kutzneria buriramensis]REH36352.1 glycosyl hydrolase family 18 (putative chitinase) [Kutzneria buriramensis]
MASAVRRALTIAAAAMLPAAALALGATGATAATPKSFPAKFAAPYLELSSGSAGDMASDKSASGVNHYTLAFLIPKSGCTPQWEDGGAAVGAFKSQISSLQSAGGDVIISFGGAEGGELALTCTSVSSLQAAYANVVKTNNVHRLDFDIEGGPLDNKASITRRDQALAALQKADPSVQVDFTLPVDPTGLESNALNLLKDAKAQGVKVSTVNIMVMDFGNGQNALNDAESASKATAKQLSSLYGVSAAQGFALQGLTPIAGKNDDNENFTQANAKTLEAFAKSNGVSELSFWEVDSYDKKVGYAYSKIFKGIEG